MKYVFFGSIIYCLAGAAASAATCIQLAAQCSQQGGGAACYENSRMAACVSSNVYTSPNGKTQETDGSGKSKNRL